jgi:hypothetical protein
LETTNSCGPITLTYHVYTRSSPVVIKEKWGVLYVDPDNSPNILSYIGYQWYKDGEFIIANAQSQYYTESGGFEP